MMHELNLICIEVSTNQIIWPRVSFCMYLASTNRAYIQMIYLDCNLLFYGLDLSVEILFGLGNVAFVCLFFLVTTLHDHLIRKVIDMFKQNCGSSSWRYGFLRVLSGNEILHIHPYHSFLCGLKITNSSWLASWLRNKIPSQSNQLTFTSSSPKKDNHIIYCQRIYMFLQIGFFIYWRKFLTFYRRNRRAQQRTPSI